MPIDKYTICIDCWGFSHGAEQESVAQAKEEGQEKEGRRLPVEAAGLDPRCPRRVRLDLSKLLHNLLCVGKRLTHSCVICVTSSHTHTHIHTCTHMLP